MNCIACSREFRSSWVPHPKKCARCCRLERESGVKSKSLRPRCATVLGIKSKVEVKLE